MCHQRNNNGVSLYGMAMFNKANAIEVVEATGTLYIHDEIQNPMIAKCWSVPQNIKHIHSLSDSTKLHVKVKLREAKTYAHSHFMNQQQYIHKRKKWKKSSCHQLTNG